MEHLVKSLVHMLLDESVSSCILVNHSVVWHMLLDDSIVWNASVAGSSRR